jgi:hypothetical protein
VLVQHAALAKFFGAQTGSLSELVILPFLKAFELHDKFKFSLDYKGIQPGMAAQPMRTR